MDGKFLNNVIRNLKCGVCGRRYGTDNINVLGCQSDVWFLNVSCPSCNGLALIVATFKQDKADTPITDLTQGDSTKFIGLGVITHDDMLDIHSYLREFDGDFIELFSKG